MGEGRGIEDQGLGYGCSLSQMAIVPAASALNMYSCQSTTSSVSLKGPVASTFLP